MDFAVKLHEAEHYFHYINSRVHLVNDYHFNNEIDKLLSIYWQFKNISYVNFEEIITRITTFFKYFDLMQRGVIPTNQETVYAIIESITDCYTYKFALQENNYKTIKSFKSTKDFIKPEFDADFCYSHFIKDYFKNKLMLNEIQKIDFNKLKNELTKLGKEFDEKAQKLYAIAENLFPSKNNIPFKPTKNVANTLLSLKTNYSLDLKNKQDNLTQQEK